VEQNHHRGTQKIMVNHGVLEISHPSYSPDLTPAVFCVPLSENLRGRKKISGIEVIKEDAAA